MLYPDSSGRGEIIRIIFDQGFQYGLILCFLVSVYGICIGCISWPRVGISRQIHVGCAFWGGAGRTVIIILHKYTVSLQLLPVRVCARL